MVNEKSFYWNIKINNNILDDYYILLKRWIKLFFVLFIFNNNVKIYYLFNFSSKLKKYEKKL